MRKVYEGYSTFRVDDWTQTGSASFEGYTDGTLEEYKKECIKELYDRMRQEYEDVEMGDNGVWYTDMVYDEPRRYYDEVDVEWYD